MSHSHHHHGDSTKNIRLAFFLNLTFTILEIVGGLYVNSVAILSDALHDLGDSLSLGLAWGLGRYSNKENDGRFSYGYRRFSLLAALINTIVLLVGSLYILTEAIPRILAPEQPNVNGMILFALVGIAVNGIAVLRVRSGESMNERIVAWHLLEDVLGWVAVLIASIVMRFVDIPILDPIMSILITSYVLYNVFGYLRQTAAIFLQAVPENIDLQKLEHELTEIEDVESVHHTHVWSLDGEHHVLSTHVIVPETTERPAILAVKRKIKSLLTDLSVDHVTVEIERVNEDCIMMPAGCEE